ncbi:MAG TPA: aminomethyltransferase family protein [Vicinamibacterales bacterium]|nr:aminomethyltransferase family protein [Vicinamibacterales bacterium]
MPVASAFHARTLQLCESLNYRDWAGFYAVSAYETHHEHEYNAIRNACALIDISPLFKYLVRGPDAMRLVNRVSTRDVSKMAVGQVYYTPWCDEHGKVIDDGTVTRTGPSEFRWTAADPNLRWFSQNASSLDVDIDDISESVAALALQGPTSRRVLQQVCDADLSTLKYFRATTGSIAGVPVEVSRTGYTGDLGYEIWMPWNAALQVWDAIVGAGAAFDLHPVGLLALDVARIEAGLLLTDVDFHSSRKALIESQKYSPFELGLGRLVDLKKGPFIGRSALTEEVRRGIARQIVGLEVDWTEVEKLYEGVGLPPTAPAGTSRVAVPVYKGRSQVGRATSTAWSTTLKKLIALATVDAPHYTIGSKVDMEITVEAVRHRATATVVPTPFFNPERKTSL